MCMQLLAELEKPEPFTLSAWGARRHLSGYIEVHQPPTGSSQAPCVLSARKIDAQSAKKQVQGGSVPASEGPISGILAAPQAHAARHDQHPAVKRLWTRVYRSCPDEQLAHGGCQQRILKQQAEAPESKVDSVLLTVQPQHTEHCPAKSKQKPPISEIKWMKAPGKKKNQLGGSRDQLPRPLRERYSMPQQCTPQLRGGTAGDEACQHNVKTGSRALTFSGSEHIDFAELRGAVQIKKQPGNPSLTGAGMDTSFSCTMHAQQRDRRQFTPSGVEAALDLNTQLWRRKQSRQNGVQYLWDKAMQVKEIANFGGVTVEP